MKAQVWSLDLIISAIIFFSAFFLLLFAWNFASTHSEEQIELQDIESRALLISDSLIRTYGIPADWNFSNVAVIGIAEGENIINRTKAERFVSLDYQTAKVLVSGRYHFYFEMRYLNNSLVTSGGYNMTAGVSPTVSTIIVPVERYALFNGKAVRTKLLLWR